MSKSTLKPGVVTGKGYKTLVEAANAAPGTFRQQGRFADLRCAQNEGLLCGKKLPLGSSPEPC